MSGFEVVGVVLGSVPLLISGLEHYRDGMGKVYNMIHYREVVKTIVDAVDTNLTIYQQSCEALLSRLILPPHTFRELLRNRNSPLWSDREIDSQLRDQFGPNKEYESYIRATKRLNQRISKLKSKLGLDDNFEPAWGKDGNVDGDKLAGFFSKSRKLSRAISIGFSQGKYLELVNDIKKDVEAIEKLTEKAKELEPVRAQRKVETAAKVWLKVRDGANRMFKALESHWSRLPCPCQSPHVASVKLEMADNRDLRLPTCDQNEQKFRLLLTFDEDGEPRHVTPWRWKIIEIQPTLDNPECSPTISVHAQDQRRYGPGPKISLVAPQKVQFSVTAPDPPSRARPKPFAGTRAIADLCCGLGQRAIPQPLRLLGFLEDEAWQHYLYIIGSSHSATTQRHDITSTQDYLGSAGQLGTMTKFKIAAQLASAVLHFHGTPWLDDRWDLCDISLIRDPEAKAGEPYITKRFLRLTQDAKHGDHHTSFISNEVIFSLGIALLELSYGRPLLSFQEPEETELIEFDNNKSGNITMLCAKISIAHRLARGLAGREPFPYVDAVRRCLQYGLDSTARGLDEPKPLALFYQGVVFPLLDIYTNWCGTSGPLKALY